MAETRDPSSRAPRPRGELAQQAGAEPEAENSGMTSSPAGVRRRRPVDPSGMAKRPGAQVPRPGMSAPPKKTRGPWLRRILLAFLILGGLGGGAYYYAFVFLPSQPAPPPPKQAVVQLPPKPAEGPALYLPPRETDKSLPRGYQADRLGVAEEVVRRMAGLKPPAADDPWCELLRPVSDPLVAAIGYQFQDKKVCELTVRYRQDKPFEEARALELAIKTYGQPSGQYTYRAKGIHQVSFWEDARSLVKMDVLDFGGERRLFAFVLMDKAGTLARAGRAK